MKSGWKKYLLYATYIIIGGGLLYGLLQLVLVGYSYSWTGFGEFTPNNPDTVPSKTLWDWMDLLIIPFVLAGGAILLNRSERGLERKLADERIKEDRKIAEDRAQLDREIANERQQDEALQTYFDRMSELLLKEKLRTTEVEEIRDVARTRTLSIMRILDTKRNNLILQFLREANLITNERSIFNGANMVEMDLENLNFEKAYLQGAKLKIANLEGATLGDANLQGAYFGGANLQDARLWNSNLVGANLMNAILQGASLQDANLQGANLQEAWLKEAYLQSVFLKDANLAGATLIDADLNDANLEDTNLAGANLAGANFWGANLKGAKNITEEQLAKVKSLKGATMPDGTKHE